MMDEDLERIVFVANLGMIPALESVSIFISTSSELQTLPSGAVRVLLPAVCVPRVPQASLENASSLSSHQLRTYEKPRGGLWLGLIWGDAGLAEQKETAVAAGGCRAAAALPPADLQFPGGCSMCTVLIRVHLTGRDKHYCGSESPDQGSRFCLAQLLESEATNPFEYDFSFHLEIRGPCLLAGRSARAILLHEAGLSPPQSNVHTLPPSLPSQCGVCFGKLTVLGLMLM